MLRLFRSNPFCLLDRQFGLWEKITTKRFKFPAMEDGCQPYDAKSRLTRVSILSILPACKTGYQYPARNHVREGSMIDQLLEGNRHFVENEFNRDLNHYSRIAQAQHPQVLWIGCSDSRVPEGVITGSKPGTIFVHRNVANIVGFNDLNIAAIVEYAMVHLKIPDIIVCGHYNCGGIQALDEGVGENYIADWLLISGEAKEKVDRMARELSLSRSQRLNLLSEENVRLQIKHLKNLFLIKNMHHRGALPRIHGWIYAMESGQINVLVDGREAEPKGEV